MAKRKTPGSETQRIAVLGSRVRALEDAVGGNEKELKLQFQRLAQVQAQLDQLQSALNVHSKK